jgi:hypothetical protein
VAAHSQQLPRFPYSTYRLRSSQYARKEPFLATEALLINDSPPIVPRADGAYSVEIDLRDLPDSSCACFERELSRLHGRAERRVVSLDLVGVGFREVGGRPIEALALA